MKKGQAIKNGNASWGVGKKGVVLRRWGVKQSE